MANENVVKLSGDGTLDTRKAAGTISPGDLIEVNSDGNVVRHSTAAGNALKAFAIENTAFNKNLSDDYSTNDQVKVIYAWTGCKVSALVAASATSIDEGDYLESAGDGTLRKLSTDAATDDTQRASVVAVAEEAVDNSSGSSKARIKVTVL